MYQIMFKMRSELIFMSIFILIAATGIIYAEDEATANTENQDVEKITYGQCVSEKAEIKNTCYESIKNTLETCKNQVTDDKKAKKDATKECKKTYKTEKKQCKDAFKKSKKDECSLIKHNFLETIGSSLK